MDVVCALMADAKERKMQNNKMLTRKEAIKIAKSLSNTLMDADERAISFLVALGLIEFKPEEIKIINVIDGDRVEIQRYGVVVHRDSDGKQRPDEPNLPPVMRALCAIMTEVEVRQGPDYDKKYVAYPSKYGAGCLIDGLRQKGYEIVKSNGEG